MRWLRVFARRFAPDSALKGKPISDENVEANGRIRGLWSAPPLRVMAEVWLLGLLLLLVLSRLVGAVSPFVLGNGTLLLCAACGMWAVLRTRFAQGGKLWPHLYELLVGLFLSLVMAVGMRGIGWLLGWQAAWTESTYGLGLTTLLLLGTGPGYVVARYALRLLFLWNRMRRRRMLWALTHAHLIVVLLVAVVFAAVLLVSLLFSTPQSLREPELAGPWTSFAARVLNTLFPAVGVLVLVTAIALLLLLPPSALLSFLVARRTTRRLEDLASAANAFQAGDYERRVVIEGEDEVAQLQSTFNAMADDLQRTLRDLETQRDTVAHLLHSRRELVAGVSHELRTPVATVRATLEAALNRSEEILPRSLRHDLEVMEGEVLRLQRLIDDLFTLARAEVGQLTLDCRPIVVAPIVTRIVEALAPLAWNKDRVEVLADLPHDLPHACGDEIRLEQILANLLRNAIRHTPPGGIVAVMADAEEETVRIEVRDTGEGIVSQDLPHIWERFYRGNDGRSNSGAGLGLALVKELTEAMGGTVEVESIVGQGSCFTVRLPRV